MTTRENLIIADLKGSELFLQHLIKAMRVDELQRVFSVLWQSLGVEKQADILQQVFGVEELQNAMLKQLEPEEQEDIFAFIVKMLDNANK